MESKAVGVFTLATLGHFRYFLLLFTQIYTQPFSASAGLLFQRLFWKLEKQRLFWEQFLGGSTASVLQVEETIVVREEVFLVFLRLVSLDQQFLEFLLFLHLNVGAHHGRVLLRKRL